MSEKYSKYLKWMRVTIPYDTRCDNDIANMIHNFLSGSGSFKEFDYTELACSGDIKIRFGCPSYFQQFMDTFIDLELNGFITCP